MLQPELQDCAAHACSYQYTTLSTGTLLKHCQNPQQSTLLDETPTLTPQDKAQQTMGVSLEAASPLDKCTLAIRDVLGWVLLHCFGDVSPTQAQQMCWDGEAIFS